jgi:hypothetical protein
MISLVFISFLFLSELQLIVVEAKDGAIAVFAPHSERLFLPLTQTGENKLKSSSSSQKFFLPVQPSTINVSLC